MRAVVYLALLSCVGLIIGSHSTNADERVNLFFPEIVEAKFQSCLSAGEVNCNLTIWTQAAQYELVNIDIASGQTGYIKRVGAWREPSIREQTVIVGEKKMSMFDRARNVGRTFQDQEEIDRSRVCDAATTFEIEGNKLEVCFKQAQMIVWTRKNPIRSEKLGLLTARFQNSNYEVPISAVAVSSSSSVNNQLSFSLIAFDVSGRLISASFRIAANSSIIQQTSDSKFLDLSSTPHPLSQDRSKRLWLERNDLMKTNPELKNKMIKDLDKKMQVAYVETITPIYRSQIESSPKENDSIAFCLSSGFYHYYSSNSMTNIRCSQNGVDQNKFVGIPGGFNVQTNYIPHAYQIISMKNSTHYHMFYSLDTNKYPNMSMYFHCERAGNLVPGVEQLGHEIKVDLDPGTKCSPKTVQNIPSDIVEFRHENCHKMIAFYDYLYRISDVDKPMLEGNDYRVLRSIFFRINAAFAIGNEIYFFTRSNKLLIIKASLENNCQELRLDTNSVRELNSQEFLYKHFLRRPGDEPLAEPFQLGYREYTEQADDTMPPLTPSTNNRSIIWLILVVLVIGALIIAGISYLLCSRAKASDPGKTLKSRRKSKQLSPKQDPELMVDTVRSHFNSDANISQKSAQTTPQIAAQTNPQIAVQTAQPVQSLSATKSKPGSAGKHRSTKSQSKSPGHLHSKSKPGHTTDLPKSKRNSPSPNKSIKSAKSVRFPKKQNSPIA